MATVYKIVGEKLVEREEQVPGILSVDKTCKCNVCIVLRGFAKWRPKDVLRFIE